MARYTMGEVKIDGIYPVDEVMELAMDIGVNRHGLLTYGGHVSKDDAKRYIQQNAEGQAVSIYLRGELEFCGPVQTIIAEERNDYWYVKVSLVTSSHLMDIDPHDRFFQDAKCSYEGILTEAYQDSSLGSLAAARGQEPITHPILQYRETDWAFTLRMAGKLGTIVVPNVASSEPQLALGIPNRRVIVEPNDIVYSIEGASGNLCYKMKSANRYRLGDSVGIGGKAFVVMRKGFAYGKGEIQEDYVLGENPQFAVPLHYNNRIAGLELEGKVVSRSGQRMLVLLDIDANRNGAANTWFCYAPATNNGMYSMPLEEEKVRLKWQSESDEDVLVVRPDRKNSRDMPGPDERHFLDENENHLKMLHNMMEFTNNFGKINWGHKCGFDVSAGRNISAFAGEDVNIMSQAQVRLFSPERITACKSGIKSSLDMISGEIHIKAPTDVRIMSKANQHRKMPLPKRSESFTVSSATASKLAAGIPQVSDARK